MRQKSNGNTFATMDYKKTGCHLCGHYISLRNGERIHKDRQTNWRKQKRKYKNRTNTRIAPRKEWDGKIQIFRDTNSAKKCYK
jgi:hypothetical protein